MLRIIRCHVLNGDITLVEDLEGVVSHVICPEFQTQDHQCRLKAQRSGDGALAELLTHQAEKRLTERGQHCHFIG